LVREERENLQRIQEEWREKLRQSEVEISIERAKIARERLELEERMRSLELERTQSDAQGADASSAGKKTKGRPRGRWLARLGLQDDES
jgi:hypothetical protein